MRGLKTLYQQVYWCRNFW